MSTGIRGVMPLGMADKTLSRKLWKDFPWESVGRPHWKGTFFFEHFNQGLGHWTQFIDTGGSIAPSVDNTDDELGAVDLITDADDNQPVEMQAGQAGATRAGFPYRPVIHPWSRWITVYEANVMHATGVTKANCQAGTFPLSAL